MTIIRKNTNPRATDVAPQFQSVLHANGMQAHISLTETGTYQLVTLSHNSSQPRYYDLSEKQLDALVNGGTNAWNKKAYNTFVSIVKDDYYIPGSWVAAKNACGDTPSWMENMGIETHDSVRLLVRALEDLTIHPLASSSVVADITSEEWQEDLTLQTAHLLW